MKKLKSTKLLLYLIIFISQVLWSTYLVADISKKINYQGRLQEDEQLVTGSKEVEFRIYSIQTGGSHLWSSGAQNVPFSRGLFNYFLGSNNPFPDGLFNNSPLYLEIVVEGTVMLPREEIVAASYAISAGGVPSLAVAGTINVSTNPVNWTQLKGVPTGFADGIDDGGVGSGDITAVGDITTGSAFTETAGNDGNSLYFEGTSLDTNEVRLMAADPGTDVTVTIPATTGTLYVSGGTDVAVADGGTGASDAAGAKTNLGFITGTGDTMTGKLTAPDLEATYGVKGATLTITSAITYTDGNQAAGRVLTSDANGNAIWAVGGGGVSDHAALTSTGTITHVQIETQFDDVATDTTTLAGDITALQSVDTQVASDTTTLRTDVDAIDVTQIGIDTGTLRTDLTAISVDTGTLSGDLTQEISDRIAGDLAIGVDTGTLRTDVDAIDVTQIGIDTTTLRTDLISAESDITALQVIDTQVATDTTTLRTDLTTAEGTITQIQIDTGTLSGDLTQEIAGRIAGDLAIGVDTATLRTDVDAIDVTQIGIDTGTLRTDLTAISVDTGTLSGDLTQEIADRVAGDLAIGVDTGTLSINLAAVAVDTGTIQAQVDLVAVDTGTLQIAVDGKLSNTSDTMTGTLTTTAGVDASTGVFSGLVTASSVTVTNALAAATLAADTLDTGQGANELYAMNQDVQTSDDVIFSTITATSGFVMNVNASPDYVLTTDGSGVATWQASGGGANDHADLTSTGTLTHLQIEAQIDSVAVDTTTLRTDFETADAGFAGTGVANTFTNTNIFTGATSTSTLATFGNGTDYVGLGAVDSVGSIYASGNLNLMPDTKIIDVNNNYLTNVSSIIAGAGTFDGASLSAGTPGVLDILSSINTPFINMALDIGPGFQFTSNNFWGLAPDYMPTISPTGTTDLIIASTGSKTTLVVAPGDDTATDAYTHFQLMDWNDGLGGGANLNAFSIRAQDSLAGISYTKLAGGTAGPIRFMTADSTSTLVMFGDVTDYVGLGVVDSVGSIYTTGNLNIIADSKIIDINNNYLVNVDSIVASHINTSSFTMNTGVTDGYVLTTDASGNASWASAGGGGIQSGDNVVWTGTHSFTGATSTSTLVKIGDGTDYIGLGAVDSVGSIYASGNLNLMPDTKIIDVNNNYLVNLSSLVVTNGSDNITIDWADRFGQGASPNMATTGNFFFVTADSAEPGFIVARNSLDTVRCSPQIGGYIWDDGGFLGGNLSAFLINGDYDNGVTMTALALGGSPNLSINLGAYGAGNYVEIDSSGAIVLHGSATSITSDTGTVDFASDNLTTTGLITSSSSTVTGQIQSEKLVISGMITDGVTVPDAVGQIGYDSSYIVYIATETDKDSWVKIGGQ
ncbi:beta strand repeat-containing protein [Elusimicrobiota bacterium]